jgi:hypothetical protein
MFSKARWSFTAAIAVGLFGLIDAEVSVAQPMLTLAERERICAFQARKHRLPGKRYTIFMEKCEGLTPSTNGGPAQPPAQPPAAASPPQPAGPLSRRAAECNKMVLELGAVGPQAKAYLDRCLAH